MHRARLPRSGQGHPGPRRRGSWSSTLGAAAPPRRPTSTSPSGPAPTPTCCVAMVNVLFADDLVDLGHARRRTSTASTSCAPRSRRSPPRPSRRVTGIDADVIRAPGPRARRRADAPPSTAASAPTPSSSARSPSWAVDVLNVLTGNLDRPGGAMFPSPPTSAAASTGPGRGFAHRPAPQPGRRASPRCHRRAPGRHAGRRDRDAGRGPGPGPRHDRRQPGAVDAQQRPPRRRARLSSTSW